ncbi:MBL fold metallo-hydrolase [Limnochorda pilosa]|uniref:Metallo-beta-lactamase domain-containing protein n=1 Tax=Limnochorda pilosa TaxID=1555112 RepID=A0A0K2SHY2_LIMPI|nr:MBL fold metallo-hydrolase [Limnochorda pilosa]BAS26459.1 hypothetical protein LIP_0602 [Limnochorda pilosa]
MSTPLPVQPPPIHEPIPGLYQVSMPIPVPLRAVNVYLLSGPEGWTVVDTGFHTAETEVRWRLALDALGIGFRDLTAIVVSHYHPDHIGCAGWLQEQSGAPVLMLRQEIPQVERFWRPGSPAGEAIAAFFEAHGMPVPEAGPLGGHHLEQVARVTPFPRITPVDPGQELRLGGWRFQVHWAPGHAEGLMVLWEPDARFLLADDLILATITPNISLWPFSVENPLDQYLSSLGRIAPLPARLVLPGHRAPIGDLAGRVGEIVLHHRDRLDRVEAIVRELERDGGPAPVTGWDVNLRLFGPQPDLFRSRFAMAETLAHLDYLAVHGRLRQEEGNGSPARICYRTV